jgi:Zn-dependent protease with chaperone function
MRFVARAPREGINVSPGHPLAEALTLTVGLAAALAICAAVFMFFVEIVIVLIPRDTETRIFARWPMLVEADFGSPDAAELQRLVDRLAAHADEPRAYRVGILDWTGPNALALPGAAIVVTQSLLDEIETERELAFVLAHEIAHFENRDHLRQLGRGAALGILIAAVSGHDAGLLSGHVVSAAAFRYARRQEYAADRDALETVFAEYGHVGEAWRFFERLEARAPALARTGGYFSTHPSPGDRARRLERLAAENGWPPDGP